MPAAAPRPCSAPGCGKLLRLGAQCPDHPRNWGKQDKRRGNRHERGYGNDWVRLRGQVMLRDKGLCQPCLGLSRYTPAAEVDHIVPKARGGTDAPNNLQAICRTCHASKTAQESNLRASSMPEWLPTPVVPVVVVCGPPGSGTTEHARQLAQPNDLVIDLMEIAARQFGGTPTQALALDGQARTVAMRTRNTMLAGLGAGCPYSRAILTVTAGKPEIRQWWRDKLKAEVVVMTAPKDECRERVRAMGLPPVRELELLKAIDTWR